MLKNSSHPANRIAIAQDLDPVLLLRSPQDDSLKRKQAGQFVPPVFFLYAAADLRLFQFDDLSRQLLIRKL